MNSTDPELEKRMASGLLDVLIRAGLILAMVLLCYQVFSPFLTLMAWAVILAVTLFPLHQLMARKLNGRQGLAATLLVLLAIILIVGPTAMLMMSLGDSVHQLINGIQGNTLVIPPPRDSVAHWPVIGSQLHAFWSQAHADLPALIQGMQPKIGDLARGALGFVASIGGELLKLLASFVIAGIFMAFGHAGGRSSRAIFQRFAGESRGSELSRLSTATIRAVAMGVVGVALIQAILIGLCLLAASVPLAGVLALIALLLGIAQVPAVIVTLPAIGYIWASGEYGNGAAILFTSLLLVAGMADNVLKPVLLGRGVDAPMPIILLGALGGMATGGILGMFVGATLFALGYQIFMAWVAAGSGADRVPSDDPERGG
ncbi:AI-2E family transporter [Sediminicoccus sp. KRV36]|uniref:AI-2E family transporter n=1 Tax=Sediminicoccus sp. KRV36 TaxID=3133721 RepID=UPI002010C3A9|nr:AI-2E family transporter [Sediminicoccus rosea]UPY38295.1 AI-2E family transporter [Sediminicoccus rosea]